MKYKLSDLAGIQFVGDLSLQDADVLAKFARMSPSVLEFGVGGSTQIIAQCNCERITSVDTDLSWIYLTINRLKKINVSSHVEFCVYSDLDFVTKDKKYSLIFVDGIDHLRYEFATKTWPRLEENGFMIFHDTRRAKDFNNVSLLANLHFNEISRVDINKSATDGQSSNMTVVYKKAKEEYINWNFQENKPLWAYGSQPNSEDFDLWKQDEQ